MPSFSRRCTCLFFFVAVFQTIGQGSTEEFERNKNFRALTENKLFRARLAVQWLPGNTELFYEVKTGPASREFWRVNAATGRREPLFDTAAVATALTSASIAAQKEDLELRDLRVSADGHAITFRTGGKDWRWSSNALSAATSTRESVSAQIEVPRASRRTGAPTTLHFINRRTEEVELFWLDTEGARRSYGKLRPGAEREMNTYAGHVWLVLDNQSQTLAAFEAREQSVDALIPEGGPLTTAPARKQPEGRRSGGGMSPDGQWRIVITNFNVHLWATGSGEVTVLSTNGSAADPYREMIHWAPDSKKVVVLRVEPAEERKVHLVESSPKDQLQPKLQTIDYRKPGDALPHPRPVLFHVEPAQQIEVADELFPNPWSITDLRWAPDSSRFTFLYNQRGHQLLRMVAVNSASGLANTVVEERSPTFIDYSGKLFVEHLPVTDELVWMSERDGWNHLYLYDTKAGTVKNQITRGPWVVRGVERVDPVKRQIWFRAGGIRTGQDPYYVHLARVNFDGSDLTILTEGNGTHSWEFSPDRAYFVDTWSRVDQPPITELRRSADGGLVCELERGDMTRLTEAGWKAPIPFSAPGRDGTTEIFGVLYLPTHQEPGRKYPVIENIYAGPHGAFVPKSFSAFSRSQELAELGFAVVQIDGMGTSQRSKAFHDVCWKNLVDAGFPDRIRWIRAAAAKFPQLDLTRVGIFGTSAGGQSALAALLTHGDFYKAAVSDCGCHDNRMDKIWWNEQWMGWPIGPHYAEQSNVTLAPRLKGDLLLMVGELDKNVDPSSTLQVVNALIRADKDFDFLLVPGAGHGVMGSPYGQRRMKEFFVRHLGHRTSGTKGDS